MSLSRTGGGYIDIAGVIDDNRSAVLDSEPAFSPIDSRARTTMGER
jgi:hypothetical protein